MSNFIKLDNNDKLCPKCGSLARTRRLWSILENDIHGKKVLHFSPSKSLKTKIESFNDIEYITTDFVGEFNATKRLNIESIDEPNDAYDLIICYHILEHVENDTKAMEELERILKPEGRCIIQTPFKAGDIYENDTVKTDEERLIHFGQKDHLRIYSAEGLINRLKSVGFNTKLLEFKEIENNWHGFKIDENLIIAEKSVFDKK
ncbi:class I SAM-dependent methyltransferase [Bizionia arctica]|nr:methyltransferase domain-containing protein [Bizionia arctica]